MPGRTDATARIPFGFDVFGCRLIHVRPGEGGGVRASGACMSQEVTGPVPGPEHFRAYLLQLARLQAEARPSGGLDPSDAVQQTLLAAVEKRHQFRGRTDAEMAGWLRAILARKMALAARRAAADPAGRARSLEAALERSSARLEAMLAGAGASPGSAAARAEGTLRLAAALAGLPDDQRRAIELRHLKEMPVAEVAATMGRTAAAVAGLLQRGARRLRELMDERP